MSVVPDETPRDVGGVGIFPTSDSTGSRLVFVTVLVLAVSLFVAQAIYLWDFSIDDVGISWRYARNFGDGHGLVWNVGGPPVEGFSNFLWVVILGGAHWAGFDIELSSKVLGIACALLTLVLILIISRRLWPDQRFWWLPSLLVVVNPWWVMWSVSGLEIAMFGLWLVLLLYAFFLSGRLRHVFMSVSITGLTLTRPEGALLAGAAVVVGFFFDPSPLWRIRINRFLPALVALVSVTALMVAFRLWYYGYPLANTVYAKYDPSLPSKGLVLEWVVFIVPWIAAWTYVWTKRPFADNRPALAVAVTSFVLEALVVLPVVPVMYFLHRYQIAMLPFVVLTIPAALNRISQMARVAGIVIAALFAIWSLQGWTSVEKRLRAEQYSMDRQRCIVDLLNQLPGRPKVGLIDAGRIPYWCNLPALDAWGLCDTKIARRGFTLGAVLEANPEVYVMSMDYDPPEQMLPRLGMDQMVFGSKEFHMRYQPWQVCIAKKPSREWYYDYLVYLNIAWADSMGFATSRPR